MSRVEVTFKIIYCLLIIYYYYHFNILSSFFLVLAKAISV